MQDIRWKQRYSNYNKMLNILTGNLRRDKIPDDFVEAVQITAIKSFELCFELMWKMLKDYLENEGGEIGLGSPKTILKTAANRGLFDQIGINGDILMKAHETRNKLVHVYDQKGFEAALNDIKNLYLAEMIVIDKYFRKLMDAKDEVK